MRRLKHLKIMVKKGEEKMKVEKERRWKELQMQRTEIM